MNDFYQKQKISHLIAAFSDWEKNLRGWNDFDFAVSLEPRFFHIESETTAISPITDDAKVRGGIGSFLKRSQNTRQINAQTDNQANETLTENLKPKSFYRTDEISELQIHLPKQLDVAPVIMGQLILSFSSANNPVSFEVLADSKNITIQFSCDSSSAEFLKQQLNAFFPDVFVTQTSGCLKSFFRDESETIIVDFGLKNNSLLSLNTFTKFSLDPLTALFSSISHLKENETVLFQILFQKASNPWAEEVNRLFSNKYFASYFESGSSGITKAVKEKLSSPLFSAVVRIAANANRKQDAWNLVKNVGGGFAQVSNPSGNELVALKPNELSHNNHLLSLFSRTSYRSGMLLSLPELVSLVHLPSDEVKSKKIMRDKNVTKSVPEFVRGHSLILGENLHQGTRQEVSLSVDQRKRHIFIAGGSGMGKSNLKTLIARQDAEQNRGFAVFCPHGDLIDDIVDNLPEHRIKDVVLIDPSDTEFAVGFNILEAHSDLEKTLLASDLIATFRRLSTSWGDLIDATFSNAILAFVESNKGGTLFELKRFLAEKDFRESFLETVKDETVKYFWRQEFPNISGKPQSSILVRLNAFLRQRLIRNIVCQKKNTLNFRKIIDEKKILLVKLSQGLVGKENSFLLGSLILSKLQQVALSRQDTEKQSRHFFGIMVDEFGEMVVPSTATILSGIRKFGVGITLGTQSYKAILQQDSSVSESISTNISTRVCFRLSDDDARWFSKGFSFFSSEQLRSLGIGEAVCRVDGADNDFNLKTHLVPTVGNERSQELREAVIEQSKKNYARPVKEIEEELRSITQPKIKIKEKVLSKRERFTHNKQYSKKGVGGKHHQEIQFVIKRMAEGNGFSAEIEKEVPEGKIDVSLTHEKCTVAVEVSVTSSADYEAKNVRKGLHSGYDYVVVTVSNQKKIPGITEKINQTLSPDDRDKVKVLSVTGLLEFLWKLTDYKPKKKKPNKENSNRLSVEEASEILGKSTSTVYRWVREGKIPFYRVGREYQFDRKELELIGRHDLSGKGKATVDLPPIEITKRTSKSKKKQDKRYRKMLGLE